MTVNCKHVASSDQLYELLLAMKQDEVMVQIKCTLACSFQYDC